MIDNHSNNNLINLFRLIMFSIVVLIVSSVSAQEVEDIKNNNDYLYGEGWGATVYEADQAALQALISKISVNVQSSFTNIEKEINQDGTMSSNSAVEMVIKTYSQVSGLPNTEQIIISEEPYAKVCRYVKRSEVDRIFDARRNKVLFMLDLAAKAESKSELDVALQQYYWAYCLIKSLPRANELTNDNGEALVAWIPAQINAVFNEIKVEKNRKEGNIVKLDITYKGYPVARLDYTYFDGRHNSVLTSASDGMGIMEMASGASTENLKIKCEYEYEDEAHRDDEVAAVVKMMKDKPFPKATVKVTGKFKTSKEKEEETNELSLSLSEQAAIVEDEVKLSLLESHDDVSQYSDVMLAVVKAIKAKNYDGASKYFTEQGKDMFQRLLKYGNARIIANPDFAYIRYGDEVICRSLKMSFSFKNNTRKFIENVTFTFNSEGLIDCLAFGLGDEASTDILLNKNYSETARIVLTQFLENYKTAFALKRIDYIESIFDDNALIITGTVVKPSTYTNKEKKKYLNNPIIRENRYTKSQYIAKLVKCFNSNEFVNIRFASNDIVKGSSDLGEVYGIQIKQDYYSSTYGDTGYLFLYVDLNEPDKPLIKVRTWQPERDPNFGLYGLGNF